MHPDTSFDTLFGGTSGIFSDSHSFNGQTLDNNLAGSGTAQGNIIDDLWTVRKTFRQMVDTVGIPYWDRDRLSNAKWVVVYPEELEQVFKSIMHSELVLQDGALSATTSPLGTEGP